MEEGRNGRRPTAEEVIAKLKDDGDFDSLRLKIIGKVKENEELRNSMITQIKQSEILAQDGSEDLKPRQLSDAIYQELGKKIMGQISDEIWKVIRSDDTKDEIKGTVESIYNKILNPTPKEEVHRSSPNKDSTVAPPSAEKVNTCDESRPCMPPGFPASPQQVRSGNKPETKEVVHLPSEQLHSSSNMPCYNDDNMPPGLERHVSGAAAANISSCTNTTVAAAAPGVEIAGDEDVDMPPGFSAAVGHPAAVASGAGPSIAWIDDDDDPDVPPGFG